MALQEEFERTGIWLFRWRSYLPLILVATIFTGMKNYHYIHNSEALHHLWEAVCLSISFFGLGIRIWTIGHTPAKTSGRNTKSQIAESLNTSGIYSIVRHPLYLGNYFMMLGVAMFPFHIWSVIVFTLLFAIYYERIMYAEEAFLRRKFGEEYLNWAAVTPAFIPRISHYRSPNLPFSLRNVLRREYNGFFALVISMFIVELYGEWRLNQRLELDLHWAILMGVAFNLWMLLRFLKKKTKLLKVDGR